MKISEIKFYKFLFFSCLFILFAQSLFIFFSGIGKKQEIDEDGSAAKILADNLAFIKPFELQSEEYNLPLELTVMNENGQLLSFRDLLSDKESLLVYRFSETHCDLCIIQHLALLNELSSKINLDKLVLLSSYSNTKKIKILRQTHNLKFSIFNIMGDIGIPLERINNPYFFVVNKDLKCHHFFSAIKENPELTISCIKAVVNE